MKGPEMRSFLIFLLALYLPAPFSLGQPKRVLKEITVSGTGYERGFQHGEQLKDDIAEIIAKWKANTTTAVGRNADQVLDAFFQYADFTGAIRKWTPELYEEVRGIADGSGQNAAIERRRTEPCLPDQQKGQFRVHIRIGDHDPVGRTQRADRGRTTR
jgi:hypothetical protein